MPEDKKGDRGGPVRLQTRPKPTTKQRRELPGDKKDRKPPPRQVRSLTPKAVKQTAASRVPAVQSKKAASTVTKAAPKVRKKSGGKQ